MKQTATDLKQIPIDMTYGFPGDVPRLKQGAQTKRLLEFFVHVAKGLDIRASARKVGYSEKWAKQYSYGYTKKYKDYLQWLQAHFAQAAAKHIGIDQEQTLQLIEAIATANDFDYLVHEEVTVDGKKVMTSRRKQLHELTRDQMVPIQVYSTTAGLAYKFRDRDGKVTELAKTMGLLNEKVILEHRHRHLHVHTDLTKVPMKRLEALEAHYEEVLLLEHKPPEPEEPPERGNGNGAAH